MAKRKPTHADLAKKYGCSTSTIQHYKAAGIDVYDAKAFREKWDSAPHNRPTAHDRTASPGGELTYEEARRRKLAAEATLKEHQVAVAEGKYTANETIKRDMLRVGGALKSGLLRLENDLPPALAGLGEADIQKKIRAATDALLRDFADTSSKLYK